MCIRDRGRVGLRRRPEAWPPRSATALDQAPTVTPEEPHPSDFSPQLGRASAMGFWTLGPVIGGLVVTEVSSNTLGSHPHWQTQSDRPARARLTGLSLPATRIPQWAGRRCRSLSRVIQSLEGTRPIGGGPGPAPDGDAIG